MEELILMRSLEEWTKYLEQQELALEQTAQTRQEVSTPRTRERSVTPVAAPKVDSEQTELTPFGDASMADASSTAIYSSPESLVPDEDVSLAKTAARLRKRVPGHMLTGPDANSEVAQNSYSVFKETREQLLQRLLDPQLSLEEAARILNVCPTTVRRYTNRGLLPHVRTAGNQRRFRLSDVLSFMESHMGQSPEIDG